MPATICHAIFSIDVYNRIEKKNRRIDADNLIKLKMFGQSTDPLMFYNIVSLKKGKDIRKLQHIFHNQHSREFFVTLCKLIKEKELYNDSEVLSFLYGFICHYVLDSNLHPFIIYKTGLFDKKKKSTYKYNCKHHYMETYLDNIMVIDRMPEYKDRPFCFRLDKFCFDDASFSDSLNEVIDLTFKDVFQIDDMSSIYFRSLQQMKFFLKHFRYDRLGIKKIGYGALDLISTKKTFKLKSLSYHYLPQSMGYLNMENNVWYNPVKPDLESTANFYDLYNQAVLEAVAIINKVNKYFDGERVYLKRLFTNKSYLTGLDCDKEFEFIKFEY